MLPTHREQHGYAPRKAGPRTRHAGWSAVMLERVPRETQSAMSRPAGRHPRYDIETEVVYTLDTLPSPRTVQTAKGVCARNLSQGGLLLEAGEHLPVGTRLTIILVRGKQGAIEVQGEVVWTEKASAQPIFQHGVRILQLDPPQELAWKSFLEEASREVGRRPLRFEVNLPLTCRRKENGENVGGRAVAVNVSRGGLLVLLSVPVPVGTMLSLEVRTPTQNLKADARVVRLEEPRSDGLIPHGLAFVGAQEGSQLLPELFLLGIL
jgi:hypothetical protein